MASFAEHYHLFRGTPSRLWLDWVFAEVFDLDVRLSETHGGSVFRQDSSGSEQPQLRPSALFERFNIEVLATTESPLDPLDHHREIRQSGWNGRVITAYRADAVMDPEYPDFTANLRLFR